MESSVLLASTFTGMQHSVGERVQGSEPETVMERCWRREAEEPETPPGRSASSKHREKNQRETRKWGKEKGPLAERRQGCSNLYRPEKKEQQVSPLIPFRTVWMSSRWPHANPAQTQKLWGQTEETFISRANKLEGRSIQEHETRLASASKRGGFQKELNHFGKPETLTMKRGRGRVNKKDALLAAFSESGK